MDRIFISLAYRFQNIYTYFKYRTLQKKYGKLDLRILDSDLRVFKQIFLDQVYYFFPEDFDPKIIVDAGANVGFSSIWFADKFPNSKIISIEPEANNFLLLEKNIKNYKNIIPLNSGLWYKDGFLDLVSGTTGSWGFETIEKTKNLDSNTVKSVSINTICREFEIDSIDLLKIDIEGAETDLFSNHPQEWLNKVKILMIETHERKRKGSTDLIFRIMKEEGFARFETSELSIFIRKEARI